MKEIPLTQGKTALVDDEDCTVLAKYRWHAVRRRDGSYVAATRIGSAYVFMHRLIMKTSSELIVDHKDHNGLNNQKYNLRNCNYSQNAANTDTKYFGKSVYKGVYLHTQNINWVAQIRAKGKRLHIGSFSCEKEAALAYNIAAVKYFGEFAKLNLVEV